jgi:hypothetical protein
VAQVTRDDIDALVGPATPQFALQLRARIEQLISDLPADDEARRYGEEQMGRLDRLAFASSKADDHHQEPRTRPGWETIPSAAPEWDPILPRQD